MKTLAPLRWLRNGHVTPRHFRRARVASVRPFLQQLEDRVMLSTLVVNNPTDAPLANETSLREAIVQANTDAAAGISDTITFDASLGSTTIKLTQGPLELSGAGTGTITIDGSSPSTPIALSAAGSRVFLIDSGVSAVITNLSMAGGNGGATPGGDILNAGTLTVSNAIVSGGNASSGGGIENQGELTLSNVTLTGNSAANSGGAVDSPGTLTVNDSTLTSNRAGGDGGAISTDGTLTVNNSTFTNNDGNDAGGAIAVVSAQAIMTGSFFTSNEAASGGALENNGGTLALTGDSLSSNSAAAAGGAIENDSGSVTLVNTTIAGNIVDGNGGGINNNAGTLTIAGSTFSSNQSYGTGSGGAIENSSGTVTMSDSTIDANVASGAGGGIDNESGGNLTLTSATLSGNSSYNGNGGGIDNNGGTLSLQNTIVAGNFDYTVNEDIVGVITTDNGNNLLGTGANNTTTNPTPGPNDVFTSTPMLGTLGDFGGPTQTMALLAGSPAIGAGNASATVPTTDQRGLPRTVNGSLDIGAFQSQAPALVFTTLGQTVDAGQAETVTVQLLDLDGNPASAGAAGVDVNLASTSSGGLFLDTDSNLLPGSSITIAKGASSATFQYVDTDAGTPTLTMTAAGFGSATQQETVLPAPISDTPVTDIVVGRTLSSYTSAGIANNQVTITYTVYNEQTDPETGVLLTTTLEPGVTFLSSSVTFDGTTTTQLPDQSGQNLTWTLGTIQDYERESVAVTVSLVNPIPLQLDSGAIAYATLDAGAVSAATPAATLIQGNIDANLLASTPDANSNDPFIQEEAAALDYNPQNIFNFLHDDVGYNSYTGSLRGARGTLWSGAGNALDVASLGVALMRASGIPAQYTQGQLSYALTQTLILTMFPASFQTVGYIPSGTQTSDPATDSQLMSETQNYFWFQFDTGNGWVNADPLIPGAQIGQIFTTPTAAFTEVPDVMRQTTEVTLTAEIYTQISAALDPGNGLSDVTDAQGEPFVLDQTFNDVDLVGRPLSIGNLVSTSSFGGLVLFSTTNTYTPYIVLGDDALPESELPDAITGEQFQEVLTNLPLASEILTGLFLNVTLGGAGTTSQTYTQTLVDRIGYAARQGIGPPESLSVNPSGPAVISPQDIYTINAVAGDIDPDVGAALVREMNAAENQLTTPAALSDTQLSAAAVDLSIYATRAALLNFLDLSAPVAANLAAISGVNAYFDSPRVTIASNVVNASGDTLALNLAHDDIQAIAFPGQNAGAPEAFQSMYGLMEGSLESQALPTGSGVTGTGVVDVFNAAAAQGIPIITLTTIDLSEVAKLSISADAMARITTALEQGLVVLVPAASVTLNGTQTVAWYQFDPTTGQLVDVAEDGAHQGLVEYEADEGEEAEEEEVFIEPEVSSISNLRALQSEVDPILDKAKEIIESGKAAIGGVYTAYDTKSIVKLIFDLIQSAKKGEAAVLNTLAEALWEEAFEIIAFTFLVIDPPIAPTLVNLTLAASLSQPNQATATASSTSQLPRGPIQGTVQVDQVAVSQQMSVSWSSTATSSFQANALSVSSATVVSSTGQTQGTGTIALTASSAVPLILSGSDEYEVDGTGGLSFYGPAGVSRAISGDWDSYSATVNGTVSITLTTDGLTLNGQTLAAGTYTITTTAATLSGSGQSTSPSSGSILINATGSTINLGPGNGDVTIGGKPLALPSGGTLTGYTGSITVAPGGGNNLDEVTLNGTAGNMLTVSATSAELTTDQNTPVTFQANVNTTLADTYTFTAQAPVGWTVAIDNNGNITATPAPGLQGGSYPIEVVVQSNTDPTLVAQTTVDVTITPTQPGMTFAVNPDSFYTVPYNSAQLPTAFQAVIHNNGPTADTYNLAVSNIPGGFTIVTSATSVTVPAGQTGIVGIYLQPTTGTIPAPGILASFTVTATSESDASIAQSQNVTFTIPAIDAVAITASPTSVSTPPGAAITDTLTLTNVGNVPETKITLAFGGSSGLTVTGLTPVSLAVGQSTTETITLTPDLATPLNSTVDAIIAASFGPAGALSQSIDILVQIIVPGAQSIATAAVAAQQLGNTGLADRLNDLGIALTNLVQNPTSGVYLSQVQANITPLIALLDADPFLAANSTALSTASAALASATTSADIDTAVINLGTGLAALAQDITDEVQSQFTLGLASSVAFVTPGASSLFNIALQNTGNTTTTYSFSVSGLPAGATASFSEPTITLAPGAQIPSGGNVVTVSISETGNTLVPATIEVIATAVGAPEITLSTSGQLILEPEVLQVAGVASTPAFTNPGGQVDVTAKIESVVNEPRQIAVSYTITDSTNAVLFTSTPMMVALGITSGLTTVDLGMLDTTDFANGYDTITVSAVDQSSQPLPTATGQGSLLIGSPVDAKLTVNTPVVAQFQGTETVTNSLALSSLINIPDPLTLDGQVQTTPEATSVALFQDSTYNLAYVAGSNGIDIVDVSNKTAPVDDGAFGGSLIVKGGSSVGRVDVIGGINFLLVGTTATRNANQFSLLIYSLSSPLSPQLVSNTLIDYQYMSDMLVEGNTVLIPTGGANFSGSGDLIDSFGSVLSIDVSDPNAPTLENVLYNDKGSPDGGDTRQPGGTIINDNIAYMASTTLTGNSVTNGVGRILVVDDSNPSDLSVLGEVDLPGTVQAIDVGIQGNRALVVSTASLDSGLNSKGNLVLSVLDMTDPANPILLSTTVTKAQFPPANSVGAKISVMSLGNGLFAVSEADVNGKPVLLLVDPSDPTNPIITATPVPALVGEMAVSGNQLYTASSQGLTIYDIGSMDAIPVTASVVVPTTGATLVAGSFNSPPNQIIQGTNTDTYVWDTTLTFGFENPTFTWQSQVASLTVGQVQAVTLGATVDFTSQGTAGTFQLPGTAVTAVSFISILPASQTVMPGGTAAFDLQLTNPASSPVTFIVNEPYGLPGFTYLQMDIDGQTGTDGNTDAFFTVAPGATVDAPVQVFGTSHDGTSHFAIEAYSGFLGGQVGETASANLIVTGQVAPAPNSIAYGVAATLTPTQATAGQGTSAQFTLQITNTGSADDSFSYQVNGLSSGISFNVDQNSLDLPPGASNFRDLPLTLTVQAGTAPGPYPFTVQVFSGNASTMVAGTMTVVAGGVSVTMNPLSGSPSETFSMLVTNTGTVADTYSLSLAGPVAVMASLSGATTVTLNPGQSTSLPITVGAIKFADAGNMTLMAVATSQADPAIQASASAIVSVPTTAGMTGQFSPATQTFQQTGPATFLLEVNNIGNLQDSYTATITGTTGPIQASLTGLDGLPTQTVPIFILPGLSTGVLVLQTNLTALEEGTVTVLVQSLTDPSITATATATIAVGAELAVPTLNITSGSSFIYNGRPEAAAGTVTGSSGEDLGMPGFTYTDTNNVISSTPPTNVGTYTVTATFAGNSNYAPTTTTATLVITPATPAVSVTDSGGTDTGSPFAASATVTGVASDGTLASSPNAAITFVYYSGNSASGQGTTDAPVDAGTYTVVANYAGGGNYASAASGPLTFAITPAATLPVPTISVTSSGSSTYNGMPQAATGTVTGSSGENLGTPTFTYTDSNNVVSSTPPTSVGTYAVTAAFAGNSSYAPATTAATLVITPATPAVSVTDDGGTDTGSPFAASATVTGVASDGTLAASPNAAITFVYYSGDSASGQGTSIAPASVGTYTVVANYAGGGDYASAASGPLTFAITPAATLPVPTISVTSSSSSTYNGMPQAATGSVTGLSGENLGTPTFTYTDSNNVVSSTPPTSVGTYAVTAAFAGNSSYAPATTSATLVITPATPTVTVNDDGGADTGNPFAASATVTGVASDGTFASSPNAAITFLYYSGNSASGQGTSVAPASVGTYTVVANYAGGGNYASVASGPLTFSITAAAAAPEPDLTVTGDLPTSATLPANVTYTLTVTNNGTATATGVILTAPVPAGMNFVSATGGVTPTSGTLSFDIGSLAIGASVVETITVTPTVGATKSTVSGTATEAQTDANPADNTFSTAIQINAAPSTPTSTSTPAPSSTAPATSPPTTTPPVSMDGPHVTHMQRYGYHMLPTTVVLTFDQALDAVTAQDVNDYRIIGPAGRIIAVKSAMYNPAALTVTLRPKQRINIHHRYTLVVDGTAPGGVTNSRGVLLDGTNSGHPDGDYRAPLTWRNLVLTGPVAARSSRPGIEAARKAAREILGRPQSHETRARSESAPGRDQSGEFRHHFRLSTVARSLPSINMCGMRGVIPWQES